MDNFIEATIDVDESDSLNDLAKKFWDYKTNKPYDEELGDFIIELPFDLMKITNPVNVVEKDWGLEIWIVNHPTHCSKMMILRKDRKCSLHLHPEKCETFLVVSGTILFEHMGETSILKEGDIITINAGEKHRFSGLENAFFMEFSSEHKENDVVRIENSGAFLGHIMNGKEH